MRHPRGHLRSGFLGHSRAARAVHADWAGWADGIRSLLNVTNVAYVADIAEDMPYSTLRFERDGNLATLTLNRPDKRNALSPEMMGELIAALDEAESSRAQVVVMTGEGNAFCAGMDLAALQAMTTQSPQKILEDARRIAQLFRRIYGFPRPLIAAVSGPAIAGGCGIATLADFTLAVPEAQFGYTEVRVGFMPAIVSVFLVKQVGEKRARDLLLTGRIFGAEEARAFGLVNEIVPAEKLLARARELAAELASLSPVSLVHTKRLLGKFVEAELDRQLELAVQESALVRGTTHFREGLAAFLEKRRPVWPEPEGPKSPEGPERNDR